MIRKMQMFRAGFFWMMISVAFGFCVIALVSTSTWNIITTIIVLLLLLWLLGINVVNRDKAKEKTSLLEAFLYISIIVVTFVGLFADVAEIKQQDSLARALFEQAHVAVGGLLLGGVTTAMLLGHWYLVQPGKSREPIVKMTRFCAVVLIVDVIWWLISPSMVQVFTGQVADGWNGTLGYMWVGACLTSFILLFFGYKALQEKSYSAVMATTGLLYLAILMVNGVELIPRSIFS